MNNEKNDYSPLHWTKYFESMRDIVIESGCFRIYTRGAKGPVLFLLHEGGSSALEWAPFAASVTQETKCRVVAIDLRGHGNTRTEDEFNLSTERLSKDIEQVIKRMYRSDPPPIILMGHGMGGSIAIHTAYHNSLPSLLGLVVIDVVEGKSEKIIRSMQKLSKDRPKVFHSMEDAIEWCVSNGQVKNTDAARVSVPGQVVNSETGELGIENISRDFEQSVSSKSLFPQSRSELSSTSFDTFLKRNFKSNSVINESVVPSDGPSVKKYKWRTDLSKTESHWPGWFKGLTNLFLSCSVPKLFVLAEIDSLDTELALAHKQEKFQTEVLTQWGKVVQDAPDKLAEILASFLLRFRFTESTGDFFSLI